MKKSFLKLLKISAIYVAFACFIFINKSFALNAGTGTPIDFGSFAQLQENAYIELDNTSSFSQSGVSNYMGNPQASEIQYTTTLTNSYSGLVTETVTLQTADTLTSSNTDCPHTITQVTPSSTSFSLQVAEGDTTSNYRKITYGATLTLTSQCKSGTYSGTISIPYSYRTALLGFIPTSSGSGTTYVDYTFKVWDKIGAEEVQSLDFGSMMSPQEDGTTVTISYAGARSKSGDIWLDPSNAGRAGSFNVISSSNRTFYVDLPASATLSGSGGTMTVDNFTSNVSSNGLTTSSDGSAVFNVGATLHVPANVSAGTYTGEYNVRVYY